MNFTPQDEETLQDVASILITNRLMSRVFDDIRAERHRQIRKWGGRTAGGLENPATTNERRLAILVEEVGEAAEAILESSSGRGELRDELVQVAAVAVAWIEGLYERDESPPLSVLASQEP